MLLGKPVAQGENGGPGGEKLEEGSGLEFGE
jgi:hypothetical protein